MFEKLFKRKEQDIYKAYINELKNPDANLRKIEIVKSDYIDNKEEPKEKVNEPFNIDSLMPETSKLSQNSYEEAEMKDKEMYIEFFGSEEDKENLKKDKEERKALKKEKEELAIEREELLKRQKEENRIKEEELTKLAEELEIKERAKKIAKQKETLIRRYTNDFSNVGNEFSDVKGMLEELKKVSLSDWESLEGVQNEDETKHTKVIEELEEFIEEFPKLWKQKEMEMNSPTLTLDELKEYPITKVVRDLKNKCRFKILSSASTLNTARKVKSRYYDLKTSALIDKNVKGMFKFLFDYISENVYGNNYSFNFEMPYRGISGEELKYTVKITVDNPNDTFSNNIKIKFYYLEEDIQLILNTAKTHSRGRMFSTFDSQQDTLDPSFDKFFVEVLSRQWNDYYCDIELKQVEGLKTKFLNKAKPFNTVDVLNNWEV